MSKQEAKFYLDSYNNITKCEVMHPIDENTTLVRIVDKRYKTKGITDEVLTKNLHDNKKKCAKQWLKSQLKK